MKPEWLETLSLSVLFKGISKESLNIMLECLKPRVKHCRPREVIVAFGQPFHGIGIIAAGKVSLTKETYSGNRIIIGILGSGEIFGETVAFSEHKVWPVTVIAQEDSVLLFLPPDKLTGTCSNVCSSHTTLIMNMLKILSNRAYMLNKKIEHISVKSLRGKVSGYLLDLSSQLNMNSFSVPLKRHELADYLNIQRPSLSREMARMRDDGLIDFKGSAVTIKNRSAMEKSVLK